MSKKKFKRVRVLFADQLNLARGKYVPMEFAEKGEVRLCIGAYAVTFDKDLIPAPGAGVLEGLPDIEAVFDPENLRPGWEKNTKVALADLQLHGKPAELSGRGALKRAIAEWQGLGLDPIVRDEFIHQAPIDVQAKFFQEVRFPLNLTMAHHVPDQLT